MAMAACSVEKMYICAMKSIPGNIITLAFSMALAALAASCDGLTRNETEEVTGTVMGFSEAYFNFDLNTAADYCTPESRKWICFLASNVQEADLEIIRTQEQNATVKVKDISYSPDDSTGTALIEAKDFLMLDTIGKSGHMKDEARFKLGFILHDGKCLIKMEGPLRSER